MLFLCITVLNTFKEFTHVAQKLRKKVLQKKKPSIQNKEINIKKFNSFLTLKSFLKDKFENFFTSS